MSYIQFPTADGASILVEVDATEVSAPEGVAKAGLLPNRTDRAVATAAHTFEDAVRSVLERNVKAVGDAVAALPSATREVGVEIAFGLKATGEVGNVALAKIGGEANLSVKLTWTATPSGGG